MSVLFVCIFKAHVNYHKIQKVPNIIKIEIYSNNFENKTEILKVSGSCFISRMKTCLLKGKTSEFRAQSYNEYGLG